MAFIFFKSLTMSEVNYFTEEGLARIKKELAEMKTKGRGEIAKQIAEAREKGDLSENAEYDAAKDAQGMLEMKISKLETTLSFARIIDKSTLGTSNVKVHTTVKVNNKKTGKDQTFTLVSENEADLKLGKISVTSPIGKGLLGKAVGEKADIQAPSGMIQFEILEITC